MQTVPKQEIESENQEMAQGISGILGLNRPEHNTSMPLFDSMPAGAGILQANLVVTGGSVHANRNAEMLDVRLLLQ